MPGIVLGVDVDIGRCDVGVPQVGVIVFSLQIDTATQKNSSRDKHL
jgi:hypothetical protein